MGIKKNIDAYDPDCLKIGNELIYRNERKLIQLESASLYDYTKISMPVEVIRGKKAGPTLFISAAIHGDELNGVEIIRRLLKKSALKHIRGTLIVVPIVNIFGFNNKSRYLPDRRDLNRSFPGNSSGSLASRLASMFMKEIVLKSDYGIDLHTGAIHRTNLPQIRANIDDDITKSLAQGFEVPVIINSKLRDGSLREAARKKGVYMLLYEGGQALRFEENVIKTGVRGCLSVIKKIGMLDSESAPKNLVNKSKTYIAQSSYWTRAPHSGAFTVKKKIGAMIKEGEVLAIISDPFGRRSIKVVAQEDGILIGVALLPLVKEGDAMFHIAIFKDSSKVKDAIAAGFMD